MCFLKYSVLLALFLYNMISITAGGDCYQYYKADTRGCQQLFVTNITKTDCCALEEVGGTSFGWTASDASKASIFRQWLNPKGTPDCIPCKVDCDEVDCGPDKKCKMKNGRPRCVCNLNCSKFDADHDGPVCGTNDKTYERPCNLYRSRCRLGENFEIAYYGVCSTNSCEHVTCPDGRYCIQDRNRRPHCVECRATCQNTEGGFVCGSDNITYESKCHLQLHSCRFEQVTKISDDRCEGTPDTCEFTSCMDGKKCDDTEDGAVCVSCGFSCTNNDYKGAVCGSDNVTYVDRCALLNEQCRSRSDLELTLNTSCDGERVAEIPPFLLPPFNNEAMQTSEKSWPINEDYGSVEKNREQTQNTDAYSAIFQKVLYESGRRSNRRRINQTKKHNQSTKSSNNRYSRGQ